LIVTLHDHGAACPKKSLWRFGSLCPYGRGIKCISCDSTNQSAARRSILAAGVWRSVPRLARDADEILAVSRSVADEAVKGGLERESIRVIYNFIDEEPCAEESKGKAQQRTLLRALPDEPFFLFVGSSDPHKGRALAEQALELVDRPASLVVAGEPGPQRRLGRRIYLGRVHQSHMHLLYERALALIVPSRWPEPCPNVVLEAMARRCAVVGTAVGGIPELLDHGNAGMVVPPESPAALADAMSELLRRPTLRDTLAEAGLQFVRRFTSDQIVGELEDVYRTTLTERKHTKRR